jgi:hypothetical protein
MSNRSRTWGAIVALVVALFAAACGDDDATTDTTTSTSTTSTIAPAAADIDVRVTNGRFSGLEGDIASGSTLRLTNDSTDEAHQLIVFLVPDEEERPVEELLALPQEEFGGLVGGLPALVVLATPGQEGVVLLGEPTMTLPGRYIYACYIPAGADPDVYQEALDSGSKEAPVFPNAGPPHHTVGELGEFTVV